MSLTPKQQRFCDEYLIDLNATQAAIRAGYSEKTAYSMGQRLLKKVEIQAEMQKAKAARQERTEITQDYVLAKIKEITDMRASDCPESDLKYANKLRALELLGKHLGVFDVQNARGGDPDAFKRLMSVIDGASNDDK